MLKVVHIYKIDLQWNRGDVVVKLKYKSISFLLQKAWPYLEFEGNGIEKMATSY